MNLPEEGSREPAGTTAAEETIVTRDSEDVRSCEGTTVDVHPLRETVIAKRTTITGEDEDARLLGGTIGGDPPRSRIIASIAAYVHFLKQPVAMDGTATVVEDGDALLHERTTGTLAGFPVPDHGTGTVATVRKPEMVTHNLEEGTTESQPEQSSQGLRSTTS